MSFDIQKVEYYNITVEDHVGEGAKMLSLIAGAGVDFLAFKAVPVDSWHTRFTLFTKNVLKMIEGAKKAELKLDGPYFTLLIQGEEKPGALAEIYEKLARAKINVSESTGIAHIKGSYGIVPYIKQEDCDKAMAALEI